MKNKKGKKLVVLGAMAALLTLIGVSGSQTYAKYIETAKVSSTQATVAKWGFTVTGNANNLFGQTYGIEDDATLAKVYVAGTSVVAQMHGTAHNIVAPGTTGHYDIHVEGQAEVNAMLSFSHLASDLNEIHLGTYYPMRWRFQSDLDGDGVFSETGDTDVEGNGLDYVLSTAETYTHEFNAADYVNCNFRLTWTWAFEQGHDAEDTMLAVLANGVDSMQYSVAGITSNYPNPEDRVTQVSFALSATIQQVQKI